MKTQRETPDFVCQKLISKLHFTDNLRILEPSAGEGKIIKFLLNNYNLERCRFGLVELNKDRIKKAESDLTSDKNFFDFFHEDFLSWKEKISSIIHYDRIIACPPFKNNIDLEHIKLMYDLLRYKGMMSTLTSPYWITNNEPHQVEFRKWLEDKEYQIEMLPDNTFVEKEKTVPTAILTIYKRK